MTASIAFLVGLLEQDRTAQVAQEDFEGEHAALLRACQEIGILSREPGAIAVPTCPHCECGVPYRLAERYLCNRCGSAIDPRHLCSWRLDVEAFLHWLASELRLRGRVRRIEERLWQVGTLESAGAVHECFYRRAGPLSEAGSRRLLAYRRALVLCGASVPNQGESDGRPHLSLVELLYFNGALTLANPSTFLRPRGRVRFDAGSGGLWAGEVLLGEVPVGSREYHFLDCLARQIDSFVPYQDIKDHVLRASGRTDSTEEATFCQNLKSRIKKRWVPPIDQFLVTTNKADGYRLRGHAEP